MRAGFWRRHRWLKWICGGPVVALAALTGVVLVLAHRAEPLLRARIVHGLENHFHARVELDSLHLALRDGLWAEGKGLRIWPPAQVVGVTVPGTAAGIAPLIRLDEFRFHAPLHYRPGQAIRISTVLLKGLEVDDKAFDRIQAVIHGMTADERRHPDIINGSRRRRIAAGSGTDIQTVNQLLTQFKQVQKMMKQLGSGRMPKNPFQMFGNKS